MRRAGHGRFGHRGDGGDLRHAIMTRSLRHFRPLAIPAYGPLQQSRSVTKRRGALANGSAF
jgi:hypothetical protein